MKITKNFTTDEMGIEDGTDYYKVINICHLVMNVLQPLRDIIQEPIKINSGLRSKEHNEKVGGVKDSQHLYGEAADFTCENIKKAFNILESGNIEFDQLIYYRKRNFIHISFSKIYNSKQIIIKE